MEQALPNGQQAAPEVEQPRRIEGGRPLAQRIFLGGVQIVLQRFEREEFAVDDVVEDDVQQEVGALADRRLVDADRLCETRRAPSASG